MGAIRRPCQWEDGGRSIPWEAPIELRYCLTIPAAKRWKKAALAQANEGAMRTQGSPACPSQGGPVKLSGYAVLPQP